jgi:hypothetical protein
LIDIVVSAAPAPIGHWKSGVSDVTVRFAFQIRRPVHSPKAARGQNRFEHRVCLLARMTNRTPSGIAIEPGAGDRPLRSRYQSRRTRTNIFEKEQY